MTSKKNDPPDIAFYDKYGYDYSKYWKTRTYEHEAEKLALESIFKKLSGNWFIDIGGSYGRHIPIYHQKFHNCILLDYSINALKQARTYLKKQGIKNIYLIAANAYNLPLRENSIHTAMMIRVLHHLETPDLFFREVKRVTYYKGSLVLEYPNKRHLLNLIRKTARGGLKKLLSAEPMPVPFENPEGTTKTEKGIMFNFHPRYITKNLVSHEILPITTTSLSFLRSRALKHFLNLSILLKIEHFLQKTMSWTRLTPSIIIYGLNNDQEDTPIEPGSLQDILACPSCKQKMISDKGAFSCSLCKLTFTTTDGILDLRYPLVST